MSAPQIFVLGDLYQHGHIVEFPANPDDLPQRFDGNRKIDEDRYLAGAALTERIIKMISDISDVRTDVEGPLARRLTDFKRRTIQGLLKLPVQVFRTEQKRFRADVKKHKAWRCTEDIGFEIGSIWETGELYNYDAIQRSIANVRDGASIVLDISLLGFDLKPEIAKGLISRLRRNADGRPIVILKLTDRGAKAEKPEDNGKSNDSMRDSIAANLCSFIQQCKKNDIVVIGIVPVEDLRGAGLFVSQAISLERSVQSTIKALNEAKNTSEPLLKIVTSLPRLLVTFCPDHVVYLTKATTNLETDLLESEPMAVGEDFCRGALYFEPLEIEGDFSARFPGSVRGMDSCIAASLAYRLNPSILKRRKDQLIKYLDKSNPSAEVRKVYQEQTKDQSTRASTLLGLKAARCVHIAGFLSLHDAKALDRVPTFKILKKNWEANDPLASFSTKLSRNRWLWPLHIAAHTICYEDLEVLGREVRSLDKPNIADKQRQNIQKESNRLSHVWQNSGWISVSRFTGRVFPFIVPKVSTTSSHRLAPFDQDWWTIPGLSYGSEEFNWDPRGKSSEPADDIWTLELALKYLIYGPNWFTSSSEKSWQDREKWAFTFLNKTSPMADAISDEVSRCAWISKIHNFWNAIPINKTGQHVAIDRREVESVRNVGKIIEGYVENPKETKPLNIAVFGPAGSGKSFVVREIIKSASPETEFKELGFNISQFTDVDMLLNAFDQVRDVALHGEMPFVFWDEFDTPKGRDDKLGWLKFFLGPMQDGEYFDGQQRRPLPRCIFIFAGSTIASFSIMQELDRRASERRKQGQVDAPGYAIDNRLVYRDDEWVQAKGPDFKSRLVVTLDVLGVNNMSQTNQEDSSIRFLPSQRNGHFFRRASVVRHSLKTHFPDLFSDEVLQMDVRVARALLKVDVYHHDARSIDKLIAGSAAQGRHRYDRTCLPPASVCRLHVNELDFEDQIDEAFDVKKVERAPVAKKAVIKSPQNRVRR